MRKLQLLFAMLVVGLIAACGGEATEGSIEVGEAQQALHCVCPAVIDPVCGKDGISYNNECEATCAGTVVVHEGKCCDCENFEGPLVCGGDGKDYKNACEAWCEGVGVEHEGRCTCICPEVIDPVCGKDGNTYENSCLAGCFGVDVAYPGRCCNPTDIYCTRY